MASSNSIIFKLDIKFRSNVPKFKRVAFDCYTVPGYKAILFESRALRDALAGKPTISPDAIQFLNRPYLLQ